MVREDCSLLLLSTLPSKRISFDLAGVSCANTAVVSGEASTNANSKVSCFFIMFFLLITGVPGKVMMCGIPCITHWLPASPHAKKAAAHRAMQFTLALTDSVQHFFLAFFSDQLLEPFDNLIPSHHHRRHFILVEIAFGLFCQLLPVQGLQFLQQLQVAARQIFGIFRFLVEAKRAAEINPPNLPVLTD